MYGWGFVSSNNLQPGWCLPLLSLSNPMLVKLLLPNNGCVSSSVPLFSFVPQTCNFSNAFSWGHLYLPDFIMTWLRLDIFLLSLMFSRISETVSVNIPLNKKIRKLRLRKVRQFTLSHRVWSIRRLLRFFFSAISFLSRHFNVTLGIKAYKIGIKFHEEIYCRIML